MCLMRWLVLNIHLYLVSILEWDTKQTCVRKIGLCIQNFLIILDTIVHIMRVKGGDTFNYSENLHLTINKIYM